MARVPLQTELTQQLQQGSEVQFTGGTVEPMKDVVSDDITRSAKALTDTGKIIQKLDDELNDAESKRLYNNFTADLNEISAEYLNKNGYEALQVVNQEEGTTTRVFDEANNQIKTLLEEYQGNASNGVVKYLFENMAQVQIKNTQTQMTQWSLKQQRKVLDEETDILITNHQENAIIDFQNYNVPDSAYNISINAGAELIKEKYIRLGAFVEVGPNGEPISPKYLEELSNYYLEIHKEVVKRFNELDLADKAEQYMLAHKEEIPIEEAEKLTLSIAERFSEYSGETIVNSLLTNNDPIDYSFTNQANTLFGLSSNYYIDSKIGASILNGFNNKELNVENLSDTERIALLEKVRSESIFYNVESNKTIVPEHQTTHLFAIQRLGVKKADKLYTSALNKIDYDKERYNTDLEYKREIDAKILDKFNSSIIGAFRRKYFLFSGEYVDQIVNDLEILKNGIRYNDVNEITGLQPIEVYQQNLKDTITDPKQLNWALKDLDIKYNNIKEEKETAYNESLVAAQEIAFQREGGWQDLAANNIDINSFTEKDQEILRNGQPEESDAEALAELIDKPEEVRDNIEIYRHKLSAVDYDELKRYSLTLQDENTYTEAVGDKDLMKDVMFKFGGYDWVYKTNFGGYAKDFNAIFKEWEDRIDYAQIQTGNKLSRQEKEELLRNVLMDKVNLQSTWFDGRSSERNILQSSDLTVGREDDIYVNVDVLQEDGDIKTEKILISHIPNNIITEIMHSLFRRGEPMNQQNIAEEWVKFGKPKNINDVKEFLKNNDYEIYEMIYGND